VLDLPGQHDLVRPMKDHRPGSGAGMSSLDLSTTSVIVYPENLDRRQLIEFARRADSAGFRAVWTIDRGSDPIAFAHEILAASERIATGTCVAVRWKRHPMYVAEVAATIDHLYPGRFAIGLGAAAWITDPRQAWGQPTDRPVARMGEYVDVVRAALTGEMVDHRGDFYDVQHQLDFGPGSRVPIYVAAGGPQQCHVGGRKADGVFFTPGPPSFLGRLADEVGSAARAGGRDPLTLRVHQLVFAFVADTREQARSHVRSGLINRVFSSPTNRRLFAEAGFAEVVASVEQGLTDGDPAAARRSIPDSVVDAFGVALVPTDSPDYVAARLAAVRAPGVTDLILWPHFADRSEWAPGYEALFSLFGNLSPG
jgi:alkanesulfonate monooxygenase SsuD/methylene tetrahydromethanopterin reductase-like flavin-dependent oxidoreductase (luciferase family)